MRESIKKRKKKIIKFLKKNKKLAKKAFKKGNAESKQRLVAKARVKIPYSIRTNSYDIFNSLTKRYEEWQK